MLQASLWGPGAQGQGRGGEEDAIDQGAELGLLSRRTAQAPRSAGETLLPPPPPPVSGPHRSRSPSWCLQTHGV